MSTEQIEFLMGHLGSLGTGVVIAAAIGFLLLKFLLPGYLGEKGKNLATREDRYLHGPYVFTIKVA